MAKRGRRRKRLFTTNRSKRGTKAQSRKISPPPEEVDDELVIEEDRHIISGQGEVQAKQNGSVGSSCSQSRKISDADTSYKFEHPNGNAIGLSTKHNYVPSKRGIKECFRTVPSKKRKLHETDGSYTSEFSVPSMKIHSNFAQPQNIGASTSDAIIIKVSQPVSNMTPVTSPIQQVIIQQNPSNLPRFPSPHSNPVNSYSNELPASYADEREVQLHIEEDETVNLSEHYSILDEIESGNQQYSSNEQQMQNSSLKSCGTFITSQHFNTISPPIVPSIVQSQSQTHLINMPQYVQSNSIAQSCTPSIGNVSQINVTEIPVSSISIINDQIYNNSSIRIESRTSDVNNINYFNSHQSPVNKTNVFTSPLRSSNETGVVPTVIGVNSTIVGHTVSNNPIIIATTIPSHSCPVTRSIGSFRSRNIQPPQPGILNIPKTSLSLVQSNVSVPTTCIGIRMPCTNPFSQANIQVRNDFKGVVANTSINPQMCAATGRFIQTSSELMSTHCVGGAIDCVRTSDNNVISQNTSSSATSGLVSGFIQVPQNQLGFASANVLSITVPNSTLYNTSCNEAIQCDMSQQENLNGIEVTAENMGGQILTINTELSDDEIEAEEAEDDEEDVEELNSSDNFELQASSEFKNEIITVTSRNCNSQVSLLCNDSLVIFAQ